MKEAIEKNWRVLEYADDRAEKRYFSAALLDAALMLGAAKKDFRALKAAETGLLKVGTARLRYLTQPVACYLFSF